MHGESAPRLLRYVRLAKPFLSEAGHGIKPAGQCYDCAEMARNIIGPEPSDVIMLPKSADTLAFRDVLERLVVFPGKEGNDTKLLSARLQHSMQVEHGVGDVARNVLHDMGVKYEIIRVRRLVIEIGKTNRIDVLGRTPVPVRIEVGTLTSSRRKDAPTAGVGLECDRPSLFFEG